MNINNTLGNVALKKYPQEVKLTHEHTCIELFLPSVTTAGKMYPHSRRLLSGKRVYLYN